MVIILAATTLCVAGLTPVSACSYKNNTSAADGTIVLTSSACASAAAKAAAFASDADECCRLAVSAALATYTNKAANARSCSKRAASTKTAGGYSCSRSAASKTAGGYSCSRSAAARAAAKTARADCCKATLAAFDTAVAKYLTAGSTSAAYSCSKNAAARAYACSKSAEAKAATKTTGSYSCSKSAETSLAAIPYREGKRMELTGSVACGHCDLRSTDACQAVFKTADGNAYPLLENNLVEKMRTTSAKKGYKVVTRVRKLDGTKYLDVETYTTL